MNRNLKNGGSPHFKIAKFYDAQILQHAQVWNYCLADYHIWKLLTPMKLTFYMASLIMLRYAIDLEYFSITSIKL